jgi:hypothetical protein
VEALDTEIGRLLRGIEHLRGETTVIFLGDNGTESCVAPPAFTQRAKGTLYEGGVHVPFIVAGPLVEHRGTECRALVNASDVFATVADVASVNLDASLGPWHVDSTSVVPYLRNPDRSSVRRWAYAEYFSPNGHKPAPLPPCPSQPVCQQDIGFDGPGNCKLSICGEPLYGAFGVNSVPVTVTGAPPGMPGELRIGPFSPSFDPALGAWFVSDTPSASVPFVTSAAGTFSGAFWTSATSLELHYQVVIADPGQPLGFTVSSALRIDPLWTYQQTARNERYKLSRFNPCHEELYDLLADPLEQTDLLLRPLSIAELAAYDELTATLDGLR